MSDVVQHHIDQGLPVLVPHMVNLFEKYVSNNSDDVMKITLVSGYLLGGGAFLIHDGGTTDFFRHLKVFVPTAGVEHAENAETGWLTAVDGADLQRQLGTDWSPNGNEYRFDHRGQGVPLHWITGSVYTEHLIPEQQLRDDHERCRVAAPTIVDQVFVLKPLESGLRLDVRSALLRLVTLAQQAQQNLPELLAAKSQTLLSPRYLGNRLGLAQVKSQRILVGATANLMHVAGVPESEVKEFRRNGLALCTLWKEHFVRQSIDAQRNQSTLRRELVQDVNLIASEVKFLESIQRKAHWFHKI
ncbi:hypothetical protein [Deinococcus sp. QL22]|uniref:hypothetical protein n=1 Tax=Deinococcus sp. QL22 TaxID=2939437 RepID=UPI002017F361|nr:hypothetical protein [Deinococcus sp. QL22]UQN07950.1 hypothetical protein M1R55_17780 [Deinococcus sp. QL22]